MNYTYSIINDFTNTTQVDLLALQDSISLPINYINSDGDSVIFNFDNTLSTEDKTILDDFVNNYVCNYTLVSNNIKCC